MSSIEIDLAATEPRAYGSFLTRLRAMLLDAIVITTAFVLILVLLTLSADVPGSGRVGVAAIVALLLFYEPVSVAMYGGTIGHRRSNLRVVDERTDGNPSFPRAALRFFLKSVLGLFSFAAMALTRRHQAIHDTLTGTTVQILDLGIASPSDVRWERETTELSGLPSKARRLAVTISYLLAVFVGMSLAMAPLLSEACALYNRCSDVEELASTTLGFLWMAASAACIIAGWRGKLWGARRIVTGAAV